MDKAALKTAIQIAESERHCTKSQYVVYDVWGNAKDGYTVNHSFHTGRFVCIPNGTVSDAVIIGLLKHYGFIPKHLHNSNFNISGELEFSLYIDYCGMPVCEFQKEEIYS